MPSLSDLFNLPKVTYNDVANLRTPERLTEAMKRYAPPKEPEWDIRSGLPEPGLGQVTPEEWLPPGAGMKLASLAKGSASLLAAGIMKPRGGVWNLQSLPYRMWRGAPPDITPSLQEYFNRHASESDIAAVKPIVESWNWRDFKPDEETIRSSIANQGILRHYKDPTYASFMTRHPQVIADRWAQGPLKNYITRDMATEGDPIRALAEEGITHLRSDQIKRMPSGEKRATIENRILQGFPAEETAKTKLGKIWERVSDASVFPGGLNEYGERVYQYSSNAPNLSNGLSRLRDIVEDGIRRGNIDPGSVSRGNFTVADAVRYADKGRRAAEKIVLNPDVFKEYPETGHRWVQLNKPGQFAAESDAMKHSVRGYEPTSSEGVYYGLGGFPAIESGKAKIFSLRDASGKPRVTVEIEALPDGSHRAVQVKGRANTVPKPEYSQMIEDLKGQFGQ